MTTNAYSSSHNHVLQQERDVSERLTLEILFNATNGSQWKRSENWSTTGTNDQPVFQRLQYGVELTKNKISKLHLRENNLCGILFLAL